jgi:hypothetical protein
MTTRLENAFLAMLFCVTFLAAAFAQTVVPVVTADQKLAVLQAQHKLDTVEKQQSDLNTQLAKISQQVTAKNQELDTARKTAQSELDKANAAVTGSVDGKLWKWDPDTLTFSPVPPPAAPANASTQPAKPASASPGAATPPVQQAKK